MPKDIYLFETRNINFLKPYVDKAQSLGFNVTNLNNAQLQDNKQYQEFLNVYEHYSVNPPGFEIACFARYFAMASVIKNDEPFLMTDTDVYITKAFKDLQGHDFKGTFVGSEGFTATGTEHQIAPHCTVWNRELLIDFIRFVLEAYKQNKEDGFLDKLYQLRKAKYIQTAISDMNLIYHWIQANKIPYLNSNSTKFPFGIDHNISELRCEDAEFKGYQNRKYLKINNDRITCFLKSGQTQNMALLHFQGIYKESLNSFYLGKYKKFRRFTIRRNGGGKVETILGMFRG